MQFFIFLLIVAWLVCDFGNFGPLDLDLVEWVVDLIRLVLLG
jgi:hypothetical protein